MSGSNCQLNNIRRFRAGLRCRLQLVGAAKGEVTQKFWIATAVMFEDGDQWEIIPEGQRTHRLKTRAFKLLAKGAGGIKFLVRSAEAI